MSTRPRYVSWRTISLHPWPSCISAVLYAAAYVLSTTVRSTVRVSSTFLRVGIWRLGSGYVLCNTPSVTPFVFDWCSVLCPHQVGILRLARILKGKKGRNLVEPVSTESHWTPCMCRCAGIVWCYHRHQHGDCHSSACQAQEMYCCLSSVQAASTEAYPRLAESCPAAAAAAAAVCLQVAHCSGVRVLRRIEALCSVAEFLSLQVLVCGHAGLASEEGPGRVLH